MVTKQNGDLRWAAVVQQLGVPFALAPTSLAFSVVLLWTLMHTKVRHLFVSTCNSQLQPFFLAFEGQALICAYSFQGTYEAVWLDFTFQFLRDSHLWPRSNFILTYNLIFLTKLRAPLVWYTSFTLFNSLHFL